MSSVELPDDPPGFLVRTELDKAAAANGFRLPGRPEGSWRAYRSTTARGRIWLAGRAPRGPWWLAVDHPGVAGDLASLPHAEVGAPARAFVLFDLDALYAALGRAYRLGVSLPDLPLDRFRTATVGLPATTEAERLVIARIGQNIFRDALMEYWCGRCPLTGISEPALLRASHIVPWTDCSDAERLNVHNGLLLSALWDAAFDRGLVSFADDGRPLAAQSLGEAARQALAFDAVPPIADLRDAHRQHLTLHRMRHGF
ncbi:HNH endonuclease [Methylobacterium sp. SyP6R]|uniref:HNH endonuclease n=1 Tax=Methylobacterium sp. SyP6R TaxID=2718876 RepID=UPI001F46513E|nr:HNH endonuclease [Methylobacterium sp. SyP6R]MCF4127898.1 HNH endonuclease [Methylobacterium sp. SyP6R]